MAENSIPPLSFSSSSSDLVDTAPSVNRFAPAEAVLPGSHAPAASNNQGHVPPIDVVNPSQDAAARDNPTLDPNIGLQSGTRAPLLGEGTSPVHPKESDGNGLLLPRRYEGHSYIDRSYDYMQKYPADVKGKELEPDARAWKVYLDESESYDNDMVKAFRDTIDAILVFAALFSSVVTGFAIETSQTLEPNYAQINVSMLFEQNLLLRAAGNATEIARVPKSPLGPDSFTHSDRDVWVNFMFFASLAMSLATALLAILIKQWLQAFTTLIPGDAKEQSLIRQFRFAGLEKWKLREIINILPLLLHLALGLFLGGLSIYVYNFHRSIRYAVISIAGSTFAFYFATAALPAIWLDCPYRQPILYIPACIVVYSFQVIHYFVFKGWCILVCCCSVHRFYSKCPSFPSSTLLSREYHHVKQSVQPLEASALAWLFSQTTNISVQRIAIQSVARFLQKHVCAGDEGCTNPPGRDLAEQYLPLDAMRSIALPNLIHATEKLEDDEALREFVLHVSHLGPNLLNLVVPKEWRSAILRQHLQLLLEGKMLPMDEYWDPATYLTSYAVHHACRLEEWNLVKKLIPHIPKSHLLEFGPGNNTVLGSVSGSVSISQENWSAIVELVRERDIDINRHQVCQNTGNTVLHVICENGKLAAVQYLFSQPGDIDCHVRNHWGGTPLHITARGSSPSHLSIVNFLLQHGADVRKRDMGGETSLHVACFYHSLDIRRALCSTASGRECINSRDDDGNTPIFDAFRCVDDGKDSELLQFIQLLLSSGADPNIANNRGMVPLHSVCGCLSPREGPSAPITEVVKELFRRTDKDKVNALTYEGETPLDELTRNSVYWGDEFETISSWMREHGAKHAKELELNESSNT